jgi:hypothetical protein
VYLDGEHFNSLDSRPRPEENNVWYCIQGRLMSVASAIIAATGV